jgi:hypothetical protein
VNDLRLLANVRLLDIRRTLDHDGILKIYHPERADDSGKLLGVVSYFLQHGVLGPKGSPPVVVTRDHVNSVLGARLLTLRDYVDVVISIRMMWTGITITPCASAIHRRYDDALTLRTTSFHGTSHERE